MFFCSRFYLDPTLLFRKVGPKNLLHSCTAVLIGYNFGGEQLIMLYLEQHEGVGHRGGGGQLGVDTLPGEAVFGMGQHEGVGYRGGGGQLGVDTLPGEAVFGMGQHEGVGYRGGGGQL